jgi:hypothetical protein
VKVLLEHADPAHVLHKSAERHIETVRDFLKVLAEEARVSDPDGFARQWQILMIGSIVAAYAGDREAAHRAKKLGLLLLADAGVRSGGRVQL